MGLLDGGCGCLMSQVSFGKSLESVCVCVRARKSQRLPENHASLSQDKCIRVFEEPGCYLYLCVCERERERKRETVRVHAYL